MSFIRCGRGQTPASHQTLALALGPTNRYVRSAYQVWTSTPSPPAENTRRLCYQRSWGIGRHIQGSEIFDYWRDPEGFIVEYFIDGDMFDYALDPVGRRSPDPAWSVGLPVTEIPRRPTHDPCRTKRGR